MEFKDILYSDCCRVGLPSQTKGNMLRTLAELAVKHPALNDIGADAICDALYQRERLMSTGFGGGIAIPHCRLSRVNDFVAGIVTVPDGLDFEAPDGEPVRLLVFIVAPEDSSDAHIRLLSQISRSLALPGFVGDLLAMRGVEDLVGAFSREPTREVIPSSDGPKCMLHIVVQNATLLEEVLEDLTVLKGVSTTVFEARNASNFLVQVPLFAGLWDARSPKPCWVVLAFLDRNLLNEALRRLQQRTGDLAEASDLLVVAQDVAFAGGRLTA